MRRCLMWSFCSDFSGKILYAFSVSLMRAICIIHLTLLDFITLIIYGEEEISQNFFVVKFSQTTTTFP